MALVCLTMVGITLKEPCTSVQCCVFMLCPWIAESSAKSWVVVHMADTFCTVPGHLESLTPWVT